MDFSQEYMNRHLRVIQAVACPDDHEIPRAEHGDNIRHLVNRRFPIVIADPLEW